MTWFASPHLLSSADVKELRLVDWLQVQSVLRSLGLCLQCPLHEERILKFGGSAKAYSYLKG